jgi:hypothetical protein
VSTESENPYAKKCGGSQICEHKRIKSRCKDCGGSSICEHGKRKTGCKECNPVVCNECSETFSKGSIKNHKKHCTGYINCSSGELAVMESLESLGFVKNETYFFDQSFDGVKYTYVLRWDFRIGTLGDLIFIEYDGEYHYFPIRASSSISQKQAEKNLKISQKKRSNQEWIL